MYAILQIGARQFKVSVGDTIDVEKIPSKEDKSITLNDVILVSDGKEIKIGQPYVKGVKVVAEVVKQLKAKKVISFKYKRRKGLRWKKGHRQNLTRLKIKQIATK